MDAEETTSSLEARFRRVDEIASDDDDDSLDFSSSGSLSSSESRALSPLMPTADTNNAPLLNIDDILTRLSQRNVFAMVPSRSAMEVLVTRAIAMALDDNHGRLAVLASNAESAERMRLLIERSVAHPSLRLAIDTARHAQEPASPTDNECLVTTPEILLRRLMHGECTLSSFSMLVFDDAHHIRGDSPTGILLRYFYHMGPVGSDSRPRVLAVTPCPIFSSTRGDSLGSLKAELEAVERLVGASAWSAVDPTRPKATCRTYSSDSVEGCKQEIIQSMHACSPKPISVFGKQKCDDEQALVQQAETCWSRCIYHLRTIGRELGEYACIAAARSFASEPSESLDVFEEMGSGSGFLDTELWRDMWSDAKALVAASIQEIPLTGVNVEERSSNKVQVLLNCVSDALNYRLIGDLISGSGERQIRAVLICVQKPLIARMLTGILDTCVPSPNGVSIATDAQSAELQAYVYDVIIHFDAPLTELSYMLRHRRARPDAHLFVMHGAGDIRAAARCNKLDVRVHAWCGVLRDSSARAADENQNVSNAARVSPLVNLDPSLVPVGCYRLIPVHGPVPRVLF